MRVEHEQPGDPGRQRRADARPRHPGRRRARSPRRRSRRGRRRPSRSSRSTRSTGGILAHGLGARRPGRRLLEGDARRAAAARARRRLRARLDVQGRDDRRGAAARAWSRPTRSSRCRTACRCTTGRSTDADDHDTEQLTVSQILAQSSNVGTVTIARAAPRRRRCSAAGSTSSASASDTGVDLPGEFSGAVLPLAKWSGTTILNFPIGEGVLVTPLQMASLYAAIADGGVWHRAARRRRSVDGRREAGPEGPPPVRAARRAHALSQMLQLVVTDRAAPAPQAQGPGLHRRRQDRHDAEARTEGPVRRRRTPATCRRSSASSRRTTRGAVILVVVDEPHGRRYYGGDVAAPAFREIAAERDAGARSRAGRPVRRDEWPADPPGRLCLPVELATLCAESGAPPRAARAARRVEVADLSCASTPSRRGRSSPACAGRRATGTTSRRRPSPAAPPRCSSSGRCRRRAAAGARPPTSARRSGRSRTCFFGQPSERAARSSA